MSAAHTSSKALTEFPAQHWNVLRNLETPCVSLRLCTQGTGNALENMNCSSPVTAHCSVLLGMHSWWNAGDAGAFAAFLLRNTLFHGIPFPAPWMMLEVVVIWFRYKDSPTGSRGPHHKAEAAAFQYPPPNPSAPCAGCPCLVPKDRQVHRSHSPEDSLVTLSPHRTQPNFSIFSTLRPGFPPCTTGLVFVPSKRTQHSWVSIQWQKWMTLLTSNYTQL